MKPFIAAARDATPYLFLELLLPGGTLFALAPWLYCHRKAN